jgi:hypothetical protein
MHNMATIIFVASSGEPKGSNASQEEVVAHVQGTTLTPTIDSIYHSAWSHMFLIFLI